jgi:predicted RNA-binding Zn-ribbon protein involved in translation (DUF1610 family)
MKITQKVRCPNCGNHAYRSYLTIHQITETSCPSCDYLMINCSKTGRVVEAYAPGLPELLTN